MQANTVPGTTRIWAGDHLVGLAITDLKIFVDYANKTVDMTEQRRLWIIRQRNK